MADELSPEWVRDLQSSWLVYNLVDNVFELIRMQATLSSEPADLKGVRVGVPHEYYVKELPEEILSVWDKGIQWLREAGAEVVQVSLPTTKLCIPAYYIIACAEASSNMSRYDGVRYGYRCVQAENALP